MGLFHMNKYLSVVVGVLLSVESYADSYVFGGRAHFNGSLVNPSCAFTLANNLKHLSHSVAEAQLQLNVSDCSSMTYYNLVIALADANAMPATASMQNTTTWIYLKPGLNLHHSIAQLLDPVSTAAHTATDQASVLAAIDETIDLPLLSPTGDFSINSQNILISVFYP